MIDEANQSLEESGTPSHEIMVIVLHREFSAGSIGITLAGGADYESKEITVRIDCDFIKVTKLLSLNCQYLVNIVLTCRQLLVVTKLWHYIGNDIV